MPNWLIFTLLAVVAIFTVVLFIAVLTEMKTKRKTGTMQGGGRSSGKGRRGRKKKGQKG